MNIKYTIKLALAGFLAVGLACLLNLKPIGALLLVFYTMVMVQTTIGETISVIKPLALWCLLGLIVGVVVSLAMAPLVAENPNWGWAAISIIVLYGAVIFGISPLAKISVITALLLGAIGGTVDATLAVAIERAAFLVCAVFISIIVTFSVFPVRAGSVVVDIAQHIAHNARDLFCRLIQGEVLADNYELAVDLRNDISRCVKAIDHARQEGRSVNVRRTRWIVSGLYRLAGYLIFLSRNQAVMRHNPLLVAVHDELVSVGRQIAHLIDGFAIAMHGQKAPQIVVDVQQLEKKISSLKEEINRCTIEEVSEFFSITSAMTTLTEDLQGFIEQLENA